MQHITSDSHKLEHHFRALCRNVLLNFLKLNFIFLIFVVTFSKKWSQNFKIPKTDFAQNSQTTCKIPLNTHSYFEKHQKIVAQISQTKY